MIYVSLGCTVAAGATVWGQFPDVSFRKLFVNYTNMMFQNVVIGGNPPRIIKKLEPPQPL